MRLIYALALCVKILTAEAASFRSASALPPGRRLHVRDPDGACRDELRADAADRGHHLLCVRFRVRPAGAAAIRRLPGFGDLCAGRRHAATAQARLLRALDRRRAGPGGNQARCPVRPADVAGHVAVLLHARIGIGIYIASVNLLRSRSGRAFMAIRDNEIAASAMGVDVALYKTLAFGVLAGITGVPAVSGHRGAVRGAGGYTITLRSRCSSAWLSAASAGCRARSWLRLHHLRAEYRGRNFEGSFRRRIRRAPVPRHLPRAARRQAGRDGRPADARATQVELEPKTNAGVMMLGQHY